MALRLYNQPQNMPTLTPRVVKPVQPTLTPRVLPQPAGQQQAVAVQPVQQPEMDMSNVKNVLTLGSKVKTTYPGMYDDLSDAEVGRKVKEKFPGAYDDFTEIPVSTYEPSQQKSLGGFAMNVAKSGGNFLKDTALGVANIFNPDLEKNTAANLARLGVSTIDKIRPGDQGTEYVANNVGRFFKERYGSKEAIKNTLYNDPVGALADVSTVLTGGAAIAGKVGTVSKATKVTNAANKVSTVGKALDPINVISKGVSKVTNAVTNKGSGLSKFGVSQATGFSPDTVSTIVNNPNEFKAARSSNLDRSDVAKKVEGAINSRLDSLSDTGKEYESIRKSTQIVNSDSSWLTKSINKSGWGSDVLAVDSKGIARPGIKPTKLVNLSSSEQQALQQFMDIWGTKPQMTATDFLDGRQFLDTWSNWQQGIASTKDGSNLFRNLRRDFNQSVGTKFKGLTTLDQKYGPEARLLKQLKKDYFTKDGELKDGALNKIANLTGRGKDKILSRLETVTPGITTDIKILKALEDVEITAGQKVGAYFRGGAGGFVMSGGNPIAAVVTAIISSPPIAIKILQAYGQTSNISKAIIKNISSKLTNGEKLTPFDSRILMDAIRMTAYQQERLSQDNN